MQGRFQIVIAIMIAAAIAWVLISPALDELPGTTSRPASLLLVATLVLGISVVEVSSLALTPPEIKTPLRLDVQAVTCTRLC